MRYPFGSTFYNTGLQQQRASQHFQQNYTQIAGGPFGMPYRFSAITAYCQNCECGGCKIHRERLLLQQEEALQEQMRLNHLAFNARRDIDIEEVLNMKPGDLLKPGSVVPLDVKPGLVTEEWWKKHRWKFYLFWTVLGVAAVVHLFMTCVTRNV